MPVGRVNLGSQHCHVSSTYTCDYMITVTTIMMAVSHHDSTRTLADEVPEYQVFWCVAGLQAILPDALLTTVAAACPSSASALVAYAKKALKKLNTETSQRDAYEVLPQHVPACFCEQSEQVCACVMAV